MVQDYYPTSGGASQEECRQNWPIFGTALSEVYFMSDPNVEPNLPVLEFTASSDNGLLLIQVLLVYKVLINTERS